GHERGEGILAGTGVDFRTAGPAFVDRADGVEFLEHLVAANGWELAIGGDRDSDRVRGLAVLDCGAHRPRCGLRWFHPAGRRFRGIGGRRWLTANDSTKRGLERLDVGPGIDACGDFDGE